MKLLSACLFLILAFVGALTWFLYAPATPPGEVFMKFPLGTGAGLMAQELRSTHVIRSRYAFLLVRLWKGGTLQAGEYRFNKPASVIDVYARIRHGDIDTRTVTIPEGFNVYEISNAVAAAGLGSASAFLKGSHANADLVSAFAPGASSLEGFLYPDTYRFSPHDTVRQMQETMVRRFHHEAELLGLDAAPDSISRVVVMASLVEKEVHFDDERALAAGVFENRLRLGMPLQTDPAVIYAALLASRWTGVIHRSDLDYDSPYNTYRHTGLPPGPICSPGVAALRAASHPATTEKLYFVADVAGHTQFSASLLEHEERVSRYRQGRR